MWQLITSLVQTARDIQTCASSRPHSHQIIQYAVPDKIWFKIALCLSLKDVLRLEATCKFLRAVVSNKSFWLERVHALDQDHAPDLPRHISTSELTLSELRSLVVRAHQRHTNCTSSQTTPLQPTHEVVVPVQWETNREGVTDGKWRYELLPGGALLLVLTRPGNLRCWDVRDRKCVWKCPSRISSGTPGMPMPEVCSFSYDMLVNGDVRVLVVSEFTGNGATERTLEIFQILPPTETETPLYKSNLKGIDESNGMVAFSKLSGDVSAVCLFDRLLLTFWKEHRSVLILGCLFDDIDFVDGYLILPARRPREQVSPCHSAFVNTRHPASRCDITCSTKTDARRHTLFQLSHPPSPALDLYASSIVHLHLPLDGRGRKKTERYRDHRDKACIE
ncbi:hypothetical protein DFH11DRAFT_312431 [Phellopilus nigrolimitatus]|nr:hypothetical protein DFH11DRAFT_312431 [Phellopilus nigrolimitatus]